MEENMKTENKTVIKCLKCSKPYPDAMNQCPYCNTPKFVFDKNKKYVKCNKCSTDLTVSTVRCPYCGSLQGRSLTNYISISVILLVVVGYFVMSTMRDTHTGPLNFSNSENLDISRTLITNNVTGCGFVRWALNPGTTSEYTVNCSMDGENWTTYIVYPKINAVTVTGKKIHEVSNEASKEPATTEPTKYLTESEKAAPAVERVPLPNQDVTTIPVIDKKGDCLKKCMKLPVDESNACNDKCYQLYK